MNHNFDIKSMGKEMENFKKEIDSIHQSMVSVKNHHFKTY